MARRLSTVSQPVYQEKGDVVIPFDRSNILKSGVMVKQGGGHRDANSSSMIRALVKKSWKKRYFQFDGNFLVYYRSGTDTKAVGFFDLSSSYRVLDGDAKHGMTNCFEIDTGTNVFVLQTLSSQDKIDWMTLLIHSEADRKTMQAYSERTRKDSLVVDDAASAVLPSSASSISLASMGASSPAGPGSHSRTASAMTSRSSFDHSDNSDSGSILLASDSASIYSVSAAPAMSLILAESTLISQLYKTGGSTHKYKLWRRRWFALYRQSVYYFKKLDSASPSGVIHLEQYSAVREVPASQGNGPAGAFYFDIILPKRVYHCYADTAEDRARWIEAISRAISQVGESSFHRAGLTTSTRSLSESSFSSASSSCSSLSQLAATGDTGGSGAAMAAGDDAVKAAPKEAADSPASSIDVLSTLLDSLAASGEGAPAETAPAPAPASASASAPAQAQAPAMSAAPPSVDDALLQMEKMLNDLHAS